MPRVVHFEIPADDVQKLITFYQQAFGWQFTKYGGPGEYFLISTGEGMGIDGGLMKKNHPDQPVTNVICVENVDDSCEAIEKAGGEVVVPKMPIPGVGYLAYFKDPEGNITGVMHPDETAS